MKKFSVIIPQRDCASLTKRCIQSIPDRKDIEVIIIDDNSHNSDELKNVEKLLNRGNCKFVYTIEGKGAGYARNIGLKIATGDWLIFADADDFFTKEAFEISDKPIINQYPEDDRQFSLW